MAVGPKECLGALELLDSARVFLEGPYRMVIVDDSGELGTWRALARYPEVDILHNWRRRGFRHLLASLQRAYRHVLRRYDFDAVLKVDTDALITGPGLDRDILAAVRADPNLGMAGSRSWPERDDPQWRRRMEESMATWGPIIERAERHGYQRGESVLGGAYVLSRRCLAAIDSAGFLRLRPKGTRIAEDVTFSLFVRAVGYEIQELAGPTQPFALAYRGLPIPPREILARGKKIIHSVKLSPSDLVIRAIFTRNRRRALERPGTPGPDVSRTIALAKRTARVCAWLRWRSVGALALRQDRPRRARRIFRRCAAIGPANVEVWLGLAGSWLPTWLLLPLRWLRRYSVLALDRLGRR